MATTSVSDQKAEAATASYDEDATHATAGCGHHNRSRRGTVPLFVDRSPTARLPERDERYAGGY